MAEPSPTPASPDAPAQPAEQPVQTPAADKRGEYGDVFFIALVAAALAKAMLSRALGLDAAGFSAGVFLEGAAIVAMLGIADLIPRRRSYLLDVGVYSVLSLVMLANVVYIAFFDTIFSPAMLSVAGQAGDVTSSIVGLLQPVYLLYVVDIPVFLAWAIVMMIRSRSRPWGRSVAVAITTALAVSVLVAQVALVIRIPSDVDARAVARARGFAAYQLASIVRLATPQPAPSTAAAAVTATGTLTPGQAVQQQMEALRLADRGSRVATFAPGAYKGKNVIIVQVEALQEIVVGQKIDGKEITPELNKLVAQSWYFPNTFSEAGVGNTVDAEFAVNSSLLPPENQAASLAYAGHVIPGLPRVLRDNGYDAITLHQNDVRFWNRKELYPALGFRAWWDKSYFKNRDKMWHASDQVLFQDGIKVLESEATSSAPFYSFFITESSHNPFTAIPMNRRPLRLSAKDEKTWAGRYVGSISYTDMAIGEFVQGLKKDGLWDKSIVIIYGDHSALLDTGPKPGDRPIPAELLQRPFTVADRQRIPLIIHLPGQTESHVDTRPAGQIDIMPTVADLVGVDVTGTPHLGRSVFVRSDALVPSHGYLPAGSFIDNTVVFMPGLGFDDGVALDVSDGAPAEKTPLMRSELDRARQLTALSDRWLRSLPHRANAGSVKDAIIP